MYKQLSKEDIRHLPFKDIRDLYKKCKNLMTVIDEIQKSNREALTNRGIQFHEIGSFGFAFDVQYVSIDEVNEVLNDGKNLIEVMLIKEGVEPLK